MLLRDFGQLGTALAALTLVPFSVSLLFGDFRVSVYYSIVITVVLLLGAGLMRIEAPKRMQSNEAMVVVGCIFVFSTPGANLAGNDFGFRIFRCIVRNRSRRYDHRPQYHPYVTRQVKAHPNFSHGCGRQHRFNSGRHKSFAGTDRFSTAIFANKPSGCTIQRRVGGPTEWT